MGAIEIVILAIGIILVAVTYILSEKFELGGKNMEEEISNNTRAIAAELVREEVERELAESIDEKVEAATVELDKIVNEKIMALGSFSEDILEKIDKNHNEVMFLYNMLNEKESTLKNTIRDIEALKLSVKKMALLNDMSEVVSDSGPKADTDLAVPSGEADSMLRQKEINAVSAENGGSEYQENTAYLQRVQAGAKNVNIPLQHKKNVQKNSSRNKNEEILRLHETGSTNIEIAKKLGIGIGEVRLVIDLFKKDAD